MATDYGVRQGLLGKGVANDDIGFDPNTGFVQVRGQNFLKPEMNVQGTTYTTKANFDNAYNQYARNQNQQQQQSLTDQYLHNISNPTASPYGQQTQDLTNQYVQRITQPQQVNPYANQLTGLIAQIQSRMNQPQQDVYSTPQYAAAKAREQQAAQEGIRAAQESLGSAGFGRSTTLGNAANRIQNQANQNLELQLVPQIQNQLQQQRQQELSNFYNLLNPIANQASRFDQQSQQGNANLLNVINLLNGQGRAQNQDLASAIGLLNNQNQQQVENDRADTTLRLQQQEQALRETQAMAALTGLLPDGTPTSAEQQRQLQNEWTASEQLGQITPALAQLYGLPPGTPTQQAKQFAMSNAIQQGQLEISRGNQAISQQNADQSAENSRISELYRQWEATGKAPAGIPGVEPGTPLFDQVGSRQSDKPKNIDNKTSVDNANYYRSQIEGKKGITKEQAMQYIQSNADFLNDSDYRSLLNWAQDHVF